jgi:hypothetical protein
LLFKDLNYLSRCKNTDITHNGSCLKFLKKIGKPSNIGLACFLMAMENQGQITVRPV